MRILYVAKNIPLPTRSDNDVIVRIASTLKQRHEIDFLFPKEFIPFFLKRLPKHSYLSGLRPFHIKGFFVDVLKYFRLPLKSVSFLLLDLLPISYQPKDDTQLVHSHFLFPDAIIGHRIAKRLGVPHVISIRMSDTEFLKSVGKKSHTFRIAQKVLSDCSGIHVLNKYSQSIIKDFFNQQSIIIPHGISKNFYIKKGKVIDTGKVEISVVGNLIRRKNFDWVIKAIKSYQGNSNVRLTIVGNGPEEEHLKKMARDQNNIIFTGRLSRNEVFEVLKSSHIFAFPSDNESFGVVYIEAAASCNAIIALRKYGITGVFDEDSEALFCEDYLDFETKLHTLIDNPDRVKKMAGAVFSKAQKYDWESVVNQYNNIYMEALSRDKGEY